MRHVLFNSVTFVIICNAISSVVIKRVKLERDPISGTLIAVVKKLHFVRWDNVILSHPVFRWYFVYYFFDTPFHPIFSGSALHGRLDYVRNLAKQGSKVTSLTLNLPNTSSFVIHGHTRAMISASG